MSWATNMIILTPLRTNEENIRKLDAGFKLADTSIQNCGGTEPMHVDVWMSSMGHYDFWDMVDRFKQIDWDMDDCVQLLIKDEQDLRFSVLTPANPKYIQQR